MEPLQQNKRLNSLDILRGFDLFVLVCLGPIIKWLAANTKLLPAAVGAQFFHTEWTGMTFWDIIMPLFMFMAGVSMPFSFAKYSGAGVHVRIARRVVLLFILGAIIQGNLLLLKPESLRLYSNTLQAIAVGYLISAMFILNFKLRGQIIATCAIFAVYWLAMAVGGDYTPDGNFAELVDRKVLGRFRDLASVKDGVVHFAPNYRYTWILSSLNFGVTVMLGVFCGHIMRRDISKLKNAASMLVFGLLLIAFGYLASLEMPVIKKIWSSSFTLVSGGWCVLLMAFSYWLIDCAKFTAGLNWLKIYGMNAIAAYVISSRIDFRSIPESVFFGLKPFLEGYYPFFINLCQYGIIFLILLMLYRHKIFLKV